MLPAQFLALIAHRASLGHVLVLSANNGLEAVILLLLSAAVLCSCHLLAAHCAKITSASGLLLIRRRRCISVMMVAERGVASRDGLRLAGLFALLEEREALFLLFLGLDEVVHLHCQI